MGVYIDMEMPKNCVSCKLWTKRTISRKVYNICRVFDKVVDAPYSKCDWCPLIEVFEPHGRLIDANALTLLRNMTRPNCEFVGDRLMIDVNMIDDAPTVIPASKEEET